MNQGVNGACGASEVQLIPDPGMVNIKFRADLECQVLDFAVLMANT